MKIKNFERYEVFPSGVIKNVKTNQVLKPWNRAGGYVGVHLNYNGISKTFSVHRIVALALIPNPENKPEVNHKDGNKLNNCVENLEWCTRSENNFHMYRVLGRRLRKKGVIAINLNTGERKIYEARADVERELKIPRGEVGNIANGKKFHKSAKGYTFTNLLCAGGIGNKNDTRHLL